MIIDFKKILQYKQLVLYYQLYQDASCFAIGHITPNCGKLGLKGTETAVFQIYFFMGPYTEKKLAIVTVVVAGS